MMEIGLINPNSDIKEPAIHLGLGYLASYAMKNHPDTHFSLLDTRVTTQKEKSRFIQKRFDLVGITATSQTFSEAILLAEAIRSKFPKTQICIGGPHPSTYMEESISGLPFDVGIYGEGEVTFSELISWIKDELNLSEIPGLFYKESNGNIITNPPRQLIKEVDQIPYPYYGLFDVKRYPQHRILTSRGCPYKCVFCNSHSIWSNRWRSRSAENIINEVNRILSEYPVKSFVFNDDSFNIDLDRVDTICELLIKGKNNIIWSSSIRIDKLNEHIAKKMKLAGCYNVSIGIESANDEILQKMGKKICREEIAKGISILRNAGIDVMGQFMIGNPGDTLQTIEESVEFAKSSELNGVEFYTTLPYRDTAVWDYVNNQGNWLTDKPGYEFHLVEPRIIFETPEFSYADRLKAIELARQNGYYHALSTDHPFILLDYGKHLAKLFQKILGGRMGNKIYLLLRSLYRKLFRKGTK